MLQFLHDVKKDVGGVLTYLDRGSFDPIQPVRPALMIRPVGSSAVPSGLIALYP